MATINKINVNGTEYEIGGSSSGGKLYIHKIKLTQDNKYAEFTLLTSESEPYENNNRFRDKIIDATYVNGVYSNGSNKFMISYVKYYMGYYFIYRYDETYITQENFDNCTITDTVVEV